MADASSRGRALRPRTSRSLVIITGAAALLVLGAASDAEANPCTANLSRALKKPLALDIKGAEIRAIEDPHGSLARFYDALIKLSAGGKDKVRVGVFGDSNHTRDWATTTLRTLLAERFGFGGHGYLAAARPWGWYRHREISNRPSGAWKSCACTTPRCGKKLYGHAGIVGLGKKRGANVQFFSNKVGATKNQEFSRMDVFYHCSRRGGAFKVEVDKVEAAVVDTRCDAAGPKVKTIQVKPGRHEVRLVATRPVARVYGIAFERKGPGVVVDNLAVGALNLAMLARTDSETFIAAMKARRYDLVIFHTGSNMWNPGAHPRWGKTIVERIRAALGKDISIIFLSPPDFAQKKDGKMVSNKRMVNCSKEKRTIALANKSAFWDYFNEMGGLGSVIKWRKKRMVKPDHVHLLPPFHKLMWTRLSHVLLDGMRKHMKKRSITCPGV